MIYGLYLSASGAAANMARLDVASNNLSNVATVGFKPDFLPVRQREVVRAEDDLPFADSNALLEHLGGGVQPMATRIALTQGPLELTHNSFDVGLEGQGFFEVQRGKGADGVHLTRDGRFTLDASGRLVTVTEGAAVLDHRGSPIRLDPSRPVSIGSDGTISQNNAPVARLAVVTVDDPDRMTKMGSNAFKPDPEVMAQRRPSLARVVQGAVEASGTNSVQALMDATGASRGAQGNFGMIGIFNDILDSAINTLGRVS
ncbi:MAG: flagellar hook basal-body protein [Phycisphaerales bacterium]|nr:flagellar hook basal-body protein [Phycisphaerales bacterium]